MVYYHAPEFDLDGSARPVPAGSIPDMGAYENPLGNPQVGITNDQLPKTNFHLSNYPNPFNPTTTIEFSVLEESTIEISIYNIKGQKMRSLLNDQITSGEHSIVWNSEDDNGERVSSGVYFIKMKTGNLEKTEKMILMK